MEGAGAHRAMRSHLAFPGDGIRVRRNFGSEQRPLWGWGQLDAAAAATVRTLLATHYAVFEHAYRGHNAGDYPLLTDLAWVGGRLVAQPGGTLPELDPRYRLLLALGVEGRATPVARAMRSDIRFTEKPGEAVLVGRGEGTKRAPMLLLAPSQVDALAFEQHVGYLQAFEAAFDRGEIDDYALFPGGKLASGRARLSEGRQVLVNERTLNDWAHALEGALGLTAVEGRGVRAWRRTFVDLYQGWPADPFTLDLITGHKAVTFGGHGSTRTDVYLDRKSAPFLREARAVMEFARTTFAREGRKPTTDELQSLAADSQDPTPDAGPEGAAPDDVTRG